MSERIERMLATATEAATQRYEDSRKDVADLEEQLKTARAHMATDKAEVQQLAAMTAVYNGGLPLPTIDDIHEAPGLGVAFGPLGWSLAGPRPVEDLKLYAQAMDRLCGVAASQSGKAMERLAEAERQAAGEPRPSTPNRETVGPDGKRSTVITMKRMCNGCGAELGDATEAEIEAGMAGQLPDVRGECPTCSPTPGVLVANGKAETREQPAVDPLAPLPLGVKDSRADVAAMLGAAEQTRPDAPEMSEECATAPPGQEHNCPGCDGCGCHVFAIGPDTEGDTTDE